MMNAISQYNLDKHYPELCRISKEHGEKSRLGHSTTKIENEIAEAMHELWHARDDAISSGDQLAHRHYMS